jgi:hypothetical protein
MKKILIAICALTILVACDKDNNESNEVKADRTVLVYISGECSLWDFIDDELKEIQTGSKTIGDNNLLVYVDRGVPKELPWLAKIHDGVITDSVSIQDIIKEKNFTPTESSVKDDPYSSDPVVFENVLRYAFDKYPSKNADYGLVLWGHGSGWLINDSIPYTAMARKKAYGVDNGKGLTSDAGKWLNVPTIAKILSKLPHLSFIFYDCCNMMCLEVGYELRNVTDYLIGSPAEIPGVGAPYQTVVPAMFERTTFWKSIVDRYYEQRANGLDVPLSVIKSSEMENLATATRTVLKTFTGRIEDTYPDMSGLIYYYYDYSNKEEFYDANNFILAYTNKYSSSNDYNSWKQALDNAVIYKKMATKWMINKKPYWMKYYGDHYEITEETYGGVSMFVPQWRFQSTENNNIQKMGWYYAAGYADIGW